MRNPILEKRALRLPNLKALRGAGRGVGRALASRPGMAGIGVAGGAGGMLGLREVGQEQTRREQEVQELQQLLQAYPELLNAPLYAQDAASVDPYAMYYGGNGY